MHEEQVIECGPLSKSPETLRVRELEFLLAQLQRLAEQAVLEGEPGDTAETPLIPPRAIMRILDLASSTEADLRPQLIAIFRAIAHATREVRPADVAFAEVWRAIRLLQARVRELEADAERAGTAYCADTLALRRIEAAARAHGYDAASGQGLAGFVGAALQTAYRRTGTERRVDEL
jgi:hypothetical protein